MKPGLYQTTIELAPDYTVDGFYFPVAGCEDYYRSIMKALITAISVLSDTSLVDFSEDIPPLATLLEAMLPNENQVIFK